MHRNNDKNHFHFSQSMYVEASFFNNPLAMCWHKKQ